MKIAASRVLQLNPLPRGAGILSGILLILATLAPVALQAHEEVPGAGVQSFTSILKGKSGDYRLDLMYSPSLPTAGEPANIGVGLKRLLVTPDPLLGSEVPVTAPPDVALVDQKTKQIVIERLPLASEGTAGDFELTDYEFPDDGSFLLRIVVHTDDGESLTQEYPISVKANAGARFRLWVNLAVAILILGLTAMQLTKIRARGGEAAEMVRPAAIGLVALVSAVFLMDRFILGAVLDFRKPIVQDTDASSVITNEDGSYTIAATVQKELGLTLVEAKEVSLGQMVNAYGMVEGRPDLTAVVQAPLWGRIEFSKGPLAVGDTVKKGQELVHVILELNALERGLMEAKDVDIKGAKKRAEDRRNAARLEYDRIKALRASSPIYEADEAWAKQLFDQATADYNEIVRQDTTYQAVMKFRDPRRTPVASPINGVITTIDFLPGELNLTAEYRNLFTIVDPSQVWVRAQVVVSDVSRLKDGKSVRVYPASSQSKPLTGKIRWIGDTIDPVNRTAPVLVDVSNEGRVFALGSFARLQFEQAQKVLAVPEHAVVDEGTSRWVYVAREQGTFAPVQVELGIKQDGWWQVTSGLVEGDQVIAKGAALLGSLPKPPPMPPEALSPDGHPEEMSDSASVPAAPASRQLTEASSPANP